MAEYRVPFADECAPSLTRGKDVQSYTDGQLKWIIDYGIWLRACRIESMLSKDEIWSIVTFLRHLPPAGSAGSPEMYSH